MNKNTRQLNRHKIMNKKTLASKTATVHNNQSCEHELLLRLHGGRKNSTGEAIAVAADVLSQPKLFVELFNGLTHKVPIVRMRAAYAVSKVASAQAKLLQAYKDKFLDCLAAPDNSPLTLACMLQTLSTLALTREDISLLKDMLQDFMFSDSSIVKTFSLQLLVDFAEADASLRPEVMPILWNALNNGTPAMRARARKLIKKYKKKLLNDISPKIYIFWLHGSVKILWKIKIKLTGKIY